MATASRERDVADVVVEIEVGILDPLPAVDPLAQTRDARGGVPHAPPETGDVGRAVEVRDVQERRAQQGVALDRPHERLGVGQSIVQRLSS